MHLCVHFGSRTVLQITREALNDGWLLNIATDGQDKDFVMAPWSERGELILSCSIHKVNRGKDLQIVEEQLDLILVNIPIG